MTVGKKTIQVHRYVWEKHRGQIPDELVIGSAFQSVCVAAGLPRPASEVQFAPPRKWRADWMFAWLMKPKWLRLVLEIEGAAWVQGRHTRGSGFVKDMEKYNALTVAGIWLLRCTPQQMASGEAVQLVKAFAESRGLLPGTAR